MECDRFHSVMVITSDSDSENLSSILSETFLTQNADPLTFAENPLGISVQVKRYVVMF